MDNIVWVYMFINIVGFIALMLLIRSQMRLWKQQSRINELHTSLITELARKR